MITCLRRWLEPLEVSCGKPLQVRREAISRSPSLRILFVSDLHLRRGPPHREALFVVDAARRECPDVILLGGDLVDLPHGLPLLHDVVHRLGEVGLVAAVSGNHDRVVGLSRVREAVCAAGGHWLEDGPLLLAPNILAHGRVPSRLEPGFLHVLCAHHPRVFPDAARAGFNLVLSGHLHGGQFVFWERRGYLYPGALLYPWNGLRFSRAATTLLVSRGVADTLPLRWNCPRELLLVHL